MTGFTFPPTWDGPSSDPNDEQFGDIVEPITLADADSGEYTALLVGEPTDRAVIGRKGAREGPSALRAELASTKTHHLTSGPVGQIGDLGDVEIHDESSDEVDIAAIQDAVSEVTRDVHALDARPVFLGGDNSLTYPNVLPLLDSGTIGVVSFDAHFDCRESDEPSSGTPYRQLFEEGLDAFACVGARHFENSTTYAEYVDGQGGVVVSAEEIGEDLEAAAQTAIDAMDDVEQVYISLDLDVLDASAAPGVSAPTPGGIMTRELYRMLRIVGADDRVSGFEVVECAPPLDIDRGSGTRGRTATAGARAIAHVLSTWTEDHSP